MKEPPGREARRPNASRFSCGRRARAFRILRFTAGGNPDPHGRSPVRAFASCNRLLGSDPLDDAMNEVRDQIGAPDSDRELPHHSKPEPPRLFCTSEPSTSTCPSHARGQSFRSMAGDPAAESHGKDNGGAPSQHDAWRCCELGGGAPAPG